jgi:peptidoglycan/xylan/chitin deacetylase (PgdA/CDA1 family)
MTGAAVALRMDDVGAASKRNEVYGITRLRVGPLAVPFPGNLLFLKYLPPIKRWGPYRELDARDWQAVLDLLAARGSRMTVGVTAGWVEADGSVTPYPKKFREAGRLVREGVERGLLEVANHGYTHCVLQDGRFRPRWFSGNRADHREFYDWLPEGVHQEHLRRAQDILQGFLGRAVVTLVPPGNVLSRKTLAAAAKAGIRYVSCLDAERWAPANGLRLVDDSRVMAFHDRDVVRGGRAWLDRALAGAPPGGFRTVGEVAAA